MTKIKPKIARSGDGAEVFTFFSLLWNGFVCLSFFLKPHDHIWLQMSFLGIGIFVLILTIYTWWQSRTSLIEVSSPTWTYDNC
jgi:hypothetical protein